jgi:hypothetical protein
MLSSDWSMKGVFFLPILCFFSFSTIAGVFYTNISSLIAKNLLTGSLKNRSIDNLETQKKTI